MASSLSHNASPEFNRWAIRLARLGLVACGTVYLVIGGLAFFAAFGLGRGGQTTDSSGAVQQISRQPFGDSLLWVLALGIIGYILWRWAQAIFDLERE